MIDRRDKKKKRKEHVRLSHAHTHIFKIVECKFKAYRDQASFMHINVGYKKKFLQD